MNLGRNQGQRFINLLHAFEIRLERVHEDTIEKLTADLSYRGISRLRIRAAVWLCTAAHAQDEHLLGAQVYGRTDGRELLYRAITAVFTVDAFGRVHEWHRRGAQQMLRAKCRAHAAAARVARRGSGNARCPA